ncbi:hypothetical protein [Streptomyces sp. NPDC007100]|uniref:hypothetical protein n=1 Tax=Streptomyces sp. NPDC007100 TaxID=3155602 RepID=UPI0033E93A8B
MAARLYTQNERIENLRAQLQGAPAGARAQRRAQAPVESGLLYGVLLRAAARLDAGFELTPLERDLLTPLESLLSREEVREIGRVYAEASEHKTAALPQAVVGRALQEGYTSEDLLRDVKAMPAVTQPNVSVIDVDALDKGTEWDTEEFRQGCADYGFGVTLVGSSAPRPAPDALLGVADIGLTLDHFRCIDDTDESTRDEIYWALSSSSDTGANTARKTREYGEIVKGSVRDFDAGTVLFSGTLRKSVAVHIACWEADDSSSEFYDELIRRTHLISEELWKFAEIIEFFPVGHYENMTEWIKLGSFIAQLIAELIEWFRNDDDLVQERTIIFERPALEALAAKPEKMDWWWFVGDGGQFKLYIKITHETGRLMYITCHNDEQWRKSTLFPSGTTQLTPAVAAQPGQYSKMYCVLRTNDSSDLKVSRFNGLYWNAFSKLAATSPSTPALAVHDGKLYCVVRGNSGHELYWATFDGTRWSGFQEFPSGSTAVAPALASHDGKLFCVVRGDGNHNLHWATFDGARWSRFSQFPSGYTPLAPALAPYNGKLYCVVRGSSGHELYWATFGGSTWSAFNKIHGATSPTTPALTSYNTYLWCVYRG